MRQPAPKAQERLTVQQPERLDSMFQRRRRKMPAVACLALAVFLSWGYRHFFNARHTSQMELAEAIAELRGGHLDQRQRDLALRIVKNHAIDLVELIKRDDGLFADAALHHIRTAAQR